MKLRTKKYIQRKKAVQDLARFKDLTSFLRAGFQLSKSRVVKKDILNTIIELKNNNFLMAQAS